MIAAPALQALARLFSKVHSLNQMAVQTKSSLTRFIRCYVKIFDQLCRLNELVDLPGVKREASHSIKEIVQLLLQPHKGQSCRKLPEAIQNHWTSHMLKGAGTALGDWGSCCVKTQ